MRRWAWMFVAGVTLAVWAPTLRYDWAHTWDDGLLFTLNPMLSTWNWWWMATSHTLGHWMPLTLFTARLTYALFGFNPAVWHALNVVLHTGAAVLFFFIAKRLVGSTLGAVFAALVFSIHPLRLESVAWISELKDCLMGVFFLGAALLWLQNRRGWAFAAFLAACASKSPAVLLPPMLLLLDWYRVRSTGWDRPLRWGWFWHYERRLIAFFAVSVAVSSIAFYGLARTPAVMSWTAVPLGPRLFTVAYSEVFYAMQTVWPHRLSNLIEYTWAPSWSQPQYPIAVSVVILAGVVCRLTWRRWPALTAAVGAYAVMVFPQAGLFLNGPQLVANRYSYLACLPFALLAGAAITMLPARKQDAAYPGVWLWPRSAVTLMVVVLVPLIVTTSVAMPMWKNGDTLWQYSALHEPTCTQCQDMATGDDLRKGDWASALRHQRQAIKVSDTTRVPRWERHWNLAALLLKMGQRDEAATELRTYLAVVPDYRRALPVDVEHMESARHTLAQLERSK